MHRLSKRKVTLNCTSAVCVCVLSYGEYYKSEIANRVGSSPVRVDRGDEVRLRALTAPEAVPGVRDLSLRR